MTQNDFFEHLYQKHTQTPIFPRNTTVVRLIQRLMLLLYPEQSRSEISSVASIKCTFESIQTDIVAMLTAMEEHLKQPAHQIAEAFCNKIPSIYSTLNQDIEAFNEGDPAAKSEYEIIRTYPGFLAIAYFRFAHELHQLQVPLIPRMITEMAHSLTGIDIHPGASIGHHFFIDHGTGIVVGETSNIGNFVKLYQGVTLGALSVAKNMASTKRHPTIEDNVVIYSGATILGGETVIGKNSIIGGNVWLTDSVPANSKIYHQENLKIK